MTSSSPFAAHLCSMGFISTIVRKLFRADAVVMKEQDRLNNNNGDGAVGGCGCGEGRDTVADGGADRVRI